MNTETIIGKFEEHEIAFDLFRGDLMVNATEMAKPFGKRPENFTRLASTKRLIAALKEDVKNEIYPLTSEGIDRKISYTKRGFHAGTFMCEELALSFAMWLSPEFNVWIMKMVKEIIFGNNPELVREAVMNMPRIQKELDRLRKRRNRARNIILGDDRRKEMSHLLSERASINHQINNLTEYSASNPLFDQPEQLGQELVRLMKEKERVQEAINKKEDSFAKLLVTDEYIALQKEITQLESEQKLYSKAIRYSEYKSSMN